jgi:hypothetical protein
LCYISGENIVISNKHPSKIRYPGDKAKLISLMIMPVLLIEEDLKMIQKLLP